MEHLKPRRDTMITYTFVYACLAETVQKRIFSCVQEYGAQDFLTFIYCCRNQEALRCIYSQLTCKSLNVELSDSTVFCTVLAPVERNEDLDFRQLVFEIQQCILKIQEHLGFKEICLPVDESVLNNLFKSSAKQNNFLQMLVFEIQDQDSHTRKSYLWLVYDLASDAEIVRCIPEALSMKRIPVDTGKSQVLINFGLLQAAKEQINPDICITSDISGLQVSAPKHAMDSIEEFILKFESSIISKTIPCPVQEKSVLLLPKVTEELHNAVAPYNAVLQIDTAMKELCVFATTQSGLTKAITAINERLSECKMLITTKIRAMFEHEQFKRFLDSYNSYSEKNDFIIERKKENLHISGLKTSVERVEQFICDCLEKHSRDSDVEMLDDDRIAAVGGKESIETMPLTTIEDVKYIDRFYKKSSDVFVKHNETGVLLSGQAFEVQKATKHIKDIVKTVSKETCEYEDNEYFSGESGSSFLKDEVEEYCQVLCELKTKVTRTHSRNAVGKRKKTHLDWERDSELKLVKRRVNKGFEVILILTNIDDREPEVVINIEDKRKGKGRFNLMKSFF